MNQKKDRQISSGIACGGLLRRILRGIAGNPFSWEEESWEEGRGVGRILPSDSSGETVSVGAPFTVPLIGSEESRGIPRHVIENDDI